MSTRWGWQKSYVNTLFVTDALVVVLAVALAHVVRFGQDSLVTMDGVGTLSYTLISVALGAAWIAFLSLFRTRSRRVIGAGFEEYQRVVSATLNLFGLVAIVRSSSGWSSPAVISPSLCPSVSPVCCSSGGSGGGPSHVGAGRVSSRRRCW